METCRITLHAQLEDLKEEKGIYLYNWGRGNFIFQQDVYHHMRPISNTVNLDISVGGGGNFMKARPFTW